MDDFINCTEEFNLERLEEKYSPLCRHHLFENEEEVFRMDKYQKAIAAKLYMRFIFLIDKDKAKEISLEIAEKMHREITYLLTEKKLDSLNLIIKLQKETNEIKSIIITF